MTVVLDSGALITACKFAVSGELIVDGILRGCRVLVEQAVEDEVAVLGAGYADGIAAAERIAQGSLEVAAVRERKWRRHLAAYALGAGDVGSLELCGQSDDQPTLVTDDYLAFVVGTRLGLTVQMLPDLLVALVECGELTAQLAEAMLQTMRPRYRTGVIEHSVVALEEVASHAEGARPSPS